MEKSFQRCGLLMTLSLIFFTPVSISVPFVVFHGFGGECDNNKVSNMTQDLKTLSGSPGYCVEIGDGGPDSVIMPLLKQASIACEKVKQMEELSEGYNIVAESQGNMVARGLIEFCDDAPPVINYVSLGGPHAGIAAPPNCSTFPICDKLKLYFPAAYTTLGQDFFAPSGYIKIPTEIEKYLEYSKYLPKLNNERPGEKNSTFKDRMTSLQNLVLIMFDNDTVLVPKETSWFGYYADGDPISTPVLPYQKTKLYTEDWIGLKTLDAAGKLKFLSAPGGHINITKDLLVNYVVPYIKNEPAFSSQGILKLNHEAI